MPELETILIVVNDDALSAATARVLKAAGYTVLRAATGADGWQMAIESRPALILLDAVMPDINGIEVCRRIKGDPSLAGTYVILLSAARTGADDRSEGSEGGADDYIVRPVSNRELLARVRAMLRIRSAEMQLNLEKQRYRRLFDSAPVMYVVARNDEGTPIVADCDRQFLITLGYTREEVIERPLADFYAPESRAAMLGGGFQRALAGDFETQERQLVCKDGRVVHTINAAEPDWDSEGRVTGTLAVYLDITTRKQAELALLRSEQRYWRLFEEAPVLQVITRYQDGEPIIEECNRLWLTALGYAREEVIGRRLADFYTPDSRRALLDEGGYQRALTGVFAAEERQLLTRDGTILHTLLTAVPETGADGQLCGTRAMYVDITARKQAETALRASEARFRQLAENAQDLIYRYRLLPERGFEYVSPSATRITGYTPEEHYADPDLGFKLVHPDDRHRLQGAANAGTDWELPIALRWQRKDGRIVWTEQINTPIYDDAGALIAIEGIARDVTERKEVEAALQRSEAMLRTILEMLPVGVWLLDGKGVIQHANPAVWEIWAGVRYVGVEGFGAYKGWWTATGRRIKPHEWPGARAVERGETPVNEMIDIECFDGARKTILDSAVPLRDTEGAVIGAVAVNQDITPLRAAEEELRRSNRELTLLNRIISASAEEVTPEDLLEMACRELARALDAPWVTALMAVEETPGDFRVVAESRPLDRPSELGTVFALAGHAVLEALQTGDAPIMIDDALADPRLEPFRTWLEAPGIRSLLVVPLFADGQLVGSLNVKTHAPCHFTAADVALAHSAARQIEASLARVCVEQAHRRLGTAIEQAAEVVVITDTAAKILYVNPAFETVTGYRRDEVIGQNPRLLKSGRHDPEFYRHMWAALTAGEIWHGRLVNRRKDGTLYTEEATISPVRNQGGDIVSYVAVKHDITRQLELEEQFLRAQRMEAVGRLTAGIAHDFNNLLTVINGFAELLRLALPSDHPAGDMAEKIQSAGKRAADLVSQLLAYSRKQMVQPQVLDLNEVVTSMDKMLQRIIGEDIELAARPGAGLWPVTIDRTQIEQIIVNLAVNARDAMPNGGRLSIETTNVTLDADYCARHIGVTPGDYVLLAVSDTGVGMSADVQSHLFEPFFTTKGVGKGTGLGLAAVYGIVKQNRGNIWVYSEVGRGSTFKVYLPRTAQPAAREAGPAALADTPVGTETILLAEDSEMVRDLALTVLRRQGYRVLVAPDGAQALQVAEDHNGPIHLLITDVVMPGMSGRVLADRLLALRPDTKVLFMSGYTEDTIAHHGVLTPRAALMEKPFSPPALARRVRDILDGED
jgi:PAS domain S-box-containing protein